MPDTLDFAFKLRRKKFTIEVSKLERLMYMNIEMYRYLLKPLKVGLLVVLCPFLAHLS
jgi:hypothetical protein